jgi:DNA-binding NarL/FixJ family response regulator
MTKSTAIVWIDDNPSRARTAEDIDAEFVNVHDQDLAKQFEDLLNSPQPELVILDHVLDKTATTNPIFQKGSTLAEAIKEKWPSCPVVGVTNVDNVQDIDVRTKRIYDALFPFQDFSHYIGTIEAIKKGFALVTRTKAKTARKLVLLLKPPEDEVERLFAALPDDLKKSSRDPSVASLLYRWTEGLMDRPGFLYNKLWTATFLGLTESGFLKVAERFKSGKYAGVFARSDDPRWWSSRLSELLYKQCDPETKEMSWHTGRQLPGIKKHHFSRCYACNDESPPETVAYLDAVSDEQYAMHLKCTELHPRYKRELYFEDIRMMRGK